MANHRYLLDYFQDGDRILLYGRGRNGYSVYQFLKGRPKLQVIGFIDQNAEAPNDTGLPAYHPEQLKEISHEAYDKIMITVINQEPGKEIYRIICDAGVPFQKIVAPYTYTGAVTALTAEKFISGGNAVKEEIRRFIKGKYGDILFFEPLILSLKERKVPEILPQLKKSLCRLTPLESIVFLYILYSAEAFDAELMRCLLEEALQINELELRQFLYTVFIDSTDMWFLRNQYLFPEYYNLRRRLLKKVCGMYGFSFDTSKIERDAGRKFKRICIVCQQIYLAKKNNNPRLMLCIELANMLAGLGHDVKIITLDPHSYIMKTPVFSSVIWRRYEGSSDCLPFYQELLCPQVPVVTSDVMDLRDRLQEELDYIFAYSPDLIFDMSDELSILSYIYSQHFTTVYYPMRGYQSSSFFTYFATVDKSVFLRENSKYRSVKENQAIEVPPYFVITPKPKAEYKREMFQLEEHDFVLVTVGDRLPVELTADFIDAVCEKLLVKETVKWMIVGSKNEYLWKKCMDGRTRSKVVYIPYENDLPALYQICDVYLNPPRMGGGTSIRWAMHAGLPCALLSAPSDALPEAGVENAAGGTIEEMMEYVLRLFENPDFYQAESMKFRNRILGFQESRTDAMQKLVNALCDKKFEA